MDTDQITKVSEINFKICARVESAGAFVNHFHFSDRMLMIEVCAESEPDLDTVEASKKIAVCVPNWIPSSRIEKAWLPNAIEVHDDKEKSRQSHFLTSNTIIWSKAVDQCLEELAEYLPS